VQSPEVVEIDTSSTVALEELERLTIQRVFDRVNGNKAKAGELLGISRATLYRKLKRYQIPSNLPTEKVPN
jgi:DNA-binding protein Fis